MEGVPKIIQSKVAANQEFKFHLSYACLKITHLYFADDLLLFAIADIPSLLLLVISRSFIGIQKSFKIFNKP